MIDRRTVLAGPLAVLSAYLLTGTRSGFAQTFPIRLVRLIVPFPVGQASDIFARRFCDHFERQLGQSFVVENRTGAGGNLGAASVARSAPDGYTLLWGTNATHAGNEFLYAKLGYDPVNDFEPIAPALGFAMVVAVIQGAKIQSVADMLAAARAKPGGLSVGLPSNTSRVVFQLFREKTGIDVLQVPYSGSGQALIGLLRNDVQVVVDTVPALLGPIRSQQVKPLATSTERRSKSLDNVPTLKEIGIDVTLEAWNALYAPRGTPVEIIQTMNRAVETALADEALRARLVQDGAEPLGGSPETLVTLMRNDRAVWEPIVRSLGLIAQ